MTSKRSYTESFRVALPLKRTWEVMSDTQHLNQLFFGMGAAQVVEKDAEKARIRGSFGRFAPEYDEYPWVFEVPRHYRSVRVFPRGLLRRMEAECKLSEDGDAATVVDYAFHLEAIDGPVGAVAAWVGCRRMQRGLRRARAYMEQLKPQDPPLWPPANPQREAVLQRARALSGSVAAGADSEKAALERLVLHVAEAPEPDVARMRPYELAESWTLPRPAVLSTFLRASQAGMLRLSWDLICPACEAATSFETLKDLPKGGHCAACDVDFSSSFEQNVEATFAPEPAVRASERLMFCHGSPQSTKSWLAQFFVEPNAKHELELTLGAGRYRVQAVGIPSATLVDADADSAAGGAAGPGASCSIVIEPDEGERKARLPSTVPAVKPGKVKLVVENKLAERKRVQLVHRALASTAATAADVTATGLYKDLFGGEALAPDQHIAVGRRSVMFTDLVGSTAMYERVGDAAAYGLVREHFRLLFAEVERYGGRVTKTVGDCVMATFDTPLDGARAGRACIVALRSLRDKEGRIVSAGPTPLKLRVGVHTGPCLAVAANGQVDYFGRTVNVAARVEGLGDADELVLSWATVDDAAVRAFLDDTRAAGDRVTSEKKRVKGVEQEVDVVRVGVT